MLKQINSKHPADRMNVSRLRVSLCVSADMCECVNCFQSERTHTHTQPLRCVVTVCVGVFPCLTKEKVSSNFELASESEEEERMK